MIVNESAHLRRTCDSSPHWKKSSNGLDLDGVAGLLVAIVVEPVLFVPKYLVNRPCQPLGTIGVHFGVGQFAQPHCNDLHRLKFAKEVAGEIDTFILAWLQQQSAEKAQQIGSGPQQAER